MPKRRHGDRHHRKPKSLGGKDDDRNISFVPVKQHRAWHTLFRNESPQEIARRINLAWLDPDFYFVCVPRKRKTGKKHHHSLNIECLKCGELCKVKRIKTKILKKL